MPNSRFWSRNTSKKSQREIGATAEAIGVDPRAVNILFNSFFDEDDPIMGWVGDLDVSDHDFAYAKAAGVMFDPLRLGHDDLIAWVLEARDKLTPLAVSDAFISSLGSRRKDIRSALGSYAHVLHLDAHSFEGRPGAGCGRCGAKAENVVDLSARNFRRLKWAGNVEHGDLGYIGSDLHLFSKLEPSRPSTDEVAAMRQVLDAIRHLPASAQLTDLNKALVGLFKSSKEERQVVLEILGYAGILKPDGWPSYFGAWLSPGQRREPGHFYKKEWRFPASGWTGRDGVNEAAVRFWFPQIA